jgi:hypothetical protein
MMPRNMPQVAHIPTISQPARTPRASWPTGGQSIGFDSTAATSQLAAPSTTKVAITISSIISRSATSLPPSTDQRRGPWVNSIFIVCQPYSPPPQSTPITSASTPTGPMCARCAIRWNASKPVRLSFCSQTLAPSSSGRPRWSGPARNIGCSAGCPL